MKRRVFLLGIAVAGMHCAGGCTSADSMLNTRGQGIKRTFKQRYDDVYASALSAATKRKLEIVSAARDTGTIVLSNGASVSSLGERIAVFVTRLGDAATSVEIVSKPVLSTITFPPDWPALLFGEIDEELVARRLRK